MQLEDITVEVRDKTMTRRGQVLPQDLDLQAALQLNNVGAWTLTLPSDHPMASVLRTPGSGIVVTGPTDVMFSGPLQAPTFDASSDDPIGTYTFTGITDEIVLADRLCLPDPTNPNPATQTLAHDARTGQAESVIHAYVNANAGPGAATVRRTPYLTMGTNGAHGPAVSTAARFDTLGVLIANIAVSANLGFRVVQRGAGRVFETYQIADRSGFIRLDIWNNTLASEQVSITAPTATQVLIAGQGDLTERQFFAATNATATAAEVDWGRRIERFVDQRQTDDVTVYTQKASEILAAEGLTGVSAKVVPMDDSTMQYGRDWNLGDRIAAVTDFGEYVAPVTGVVLSINSDAVKLGAAVGDLSRIDGRQATAAQINTLLQRVSNLERT